MCGRFVQATDPDLYADYFSILDPPRLEPRYNLAPTDPVAVVRQEDAGRHLRLMRWGLVPGWAKDPGVGARMFNARAETVADKPAFRAAFRRRRCLIPADGFYEWQPRERGPKQPWYFHTITGHPLALAGLWDRWKRPEGDVLESCTIITAPAAGPVGEVHDRMPVIVEPGDFATWLDPGTVEPGVLKAILAGGRDPRLQAHPVGRGVNRSGNEGPELIRPA
jgi:putative SOS response-associated peptidase YedK